MRWGDVIGKRAELMFQHHHLWKRGLCIGWVSYRIASHSVAFCVKVSTLGDCI